MYSLQKIKEDPSGFGTSCSIQELEDLPKAAQAYHNTDRRIISDIVYDILVDILEERCPTDHILTSVGCLVDDDNKVKPHYMGSADKIKKKDKIFTWINKFQDPKSICN